MPDFSELDDHCIFSSCEKSSSHAIVASELADHLLHWHGDKVDARMCKLDTDNLSLYSLKYGSAVDIYPATYDSFSLVHFSLAKAIEVTADGCKILVPKGRALVSSPRQNICLNYEEGSEQVILRIPHVLTWRMAQKAGQLALHHRFIDAPGLLMSEKSSEFWQSHLQSFVALDRSCRMDHARSAWRQHFEESFALFLLMQFGEWREPAATPDFGDGARSQRLEKLIQFVRANLNEPLTLPDMALAVGMSERQLNVMCHEEFEQSPMQWIRGLRLDAIRDALKKDPRPNVTALAMWYGFFHLGRFSSYYKQRFGELPSETVQAAKTG